MNRSSVRAFAIVPAAGRSKRMGRPKLLLPWGESTVIEQTLAAWQSSRVAGVAVIVCPGDLQLAELVRESGAHVVVPAEPPPEMKLSVWHGLQFVRKTFQPAPDDAWLLAPADMPLLSSTAINWLLECHARGDRDQILVPQYQGHHGHPVLFPWLLSDQVAALAPDQGIDALVHRGPTQYLDTDNERILTDVDTPEDYERLRPSSGPDANSKT